LTNDIKHAQHAVSLNGLT